ncbi:AprI/Inh family metalloprotease inhibitor [Microvirga sp. TS319]|uniref:AprI/Inh family metalloprotease inhibitor n=1 Tax=Microvirga sp. TS319 TaxID=3241165 RepID=UPI00351A3B9C
MSGLGYSVENAPASVEPPISGRQRYYRDSGLPNDPRPPGEVPTTSRTMMPVVEPISPSSEPSMPAASAHPSIAAVSPPGIFSAPRRASSYTGTWRVRDADGKSCIVHLSNTASLDLYKASVSKCDNEALRRVNLWKFEGSNVTLLTRGVEIARLEGTEASLNGTFNQSGARLQMTR